MTGPLSAIGRDWDSFADAVTDFQADLLRRAAKDMADALDRAAQRDVEGGREWRDLNRKEDRYAG